MSKNDEKEYWKIIREKFGAGDHRAFETIYSDFVAEFDSGFPLVESEPKELYKFNLGSMFWSLKL